MLMKHVIFITSYAGNFNGKDYKERGGIYGSELACIHVATQLTRWYDVTIFVNDDVDVTVDKVRYVHWGEYETVCKDHPPDICVVSRYINFWLYNTNYAKQTYVWVHDVYPHSAFRGEALPNNGFPLINNLLPTIDKFVCVGKTQMHEILEDRMKLPLNKLCYIPNGLEITEPHSLDKILPKKRKNSFIFCSSPDRFLNILLRLFPKISNILEGATLDIYYSEVPDDCKELMQHQPNVKCHGKVPHARLQEIMQSTEYWLYPTKFFETCCTTAIETAYNGCIQITSYVGALKENVKGIVIKHDPTSHEFEAELLQFFINVTPQQKKEIIQRQFEWAKEQTWTHRGGVWHNLFEKNDASFTVPNSVMYHRTTTPKEHIIFPYQQKWYSKGFGNKTISNVCVECKWIEAMEEFVSSTYEFLSLDCDGDLQLFKKQIKCCFVVEGKEEIKRKFSTNDVTTARVILSRKGVEMVLSVIHKSGLHHLPLTHIAYNIFGVNARVLRCTPRLPHISHNETPAQSPSFTIGCAMMVKNEALNICKSLESVRKWVSCIVIYDTGSTDNTIEVISKWCETNKMPLHVKQGRFVDFSVSRNVLLKFADDKADYLILLDASDELQNGEEMYYAVAQQPSKFVFKVTQRWHTPQQDIVFTNNRFLRTKHQFEYEYPIHEVIDHRNPEYVGEMMDVVIYQDRLEDLAKSKKRWVRDKDILLKERIKRKNDNRIVFYLAQTYKCLYLNDLAVATYLQRIQKEGYQDEVEESYIAIYECVNRDENIMSKEKVMVLMKELWEKYQRGEGAFYLAKEYIHQENYEEAQKWAKIACEAPYPDTKLWVKQELFSHDRWQMLAITSLQTNDIHTGYKALQQALVSGCNTETNKKLLKEYNKLI